MVHANILGVDNLILRDDSNDENSSLTRQSQEARPQEHTPLQQWRLREGLCRLTLRDPHGEVAEGQEGGSERESD